MTEKSTLVRWSNAMVRHWINYVYSITRGNGNLTKIVKKITSKTSSYLTTRKGLSAHVRRIQMSFETCSAPLILSNPFTKKIIKNA